MKQLHKLIDLIAADVLIKERDNIFTKYAFILSLLKKKTSLFFPTPTLTNPPPPPLPEGVLAGGDCILMVG
ncbi:hypothetical protein [Bacteroides heparinolyticus]|uniref:hypothetical protein n=1 Tax=Prevotella heparinolytica TaxID=28113 RepID=UPI0028EF9992|nr:hypothetical protein [Bacteroides heparinolyticus]